MEESSKEYQNTFIANVIVDSMLDTEHVGFLAVQSTAVLENASFKYTYTIGRTDKRQPEVILCCPMSEQQANMVLNYAIKTNPPEATEPDEVFDLVDIASGQNRRHRWMKLDSHTAKYIRRDLMPLLDYRYSVEMIDTIDVYQLLIADASNILPNEPNYNPAFDQVILVAANQGK